MHFRAFWMYVSINPINKEPIAPTVNETTCTLQLHDIIEHQEWYQLSYNGVKTPI